MNHSRLHALTDGIFAIVMTLLVLELKVPVQKVVSNGALWEILKGQSAIFISYFISFTVLFVYWRVHNYIITILTRNITISLLNFNAVFLFFVGVVPFSTHILGAYPHVPLAICVYAVNVILIGLTLVVMRWFVDNSAHIATLKRTQEQRFAAAVRGLTPVAFAVVAIPVSFISTDTAFGILLFAVAYNFHPSAGTLTIKYFIGPVARLKTRLKAS
jgi:uncharacterized membrane protein